MMRVADTGMIERPRAGERAVLVRLGLGTPVKREDLEEFEQLARSAGAYPVATITGRRERPDPRYFVGSGKAQEIASAARAENAELILFDHPLSPSQQRNLERLSGVRVLDRSGLILDIFARRARSFEGKLEVELAQLKHQSSRLVRGWTHLERQKGGIGMRGGPAKRSWRPTGGCSRAHALGDASPGASQAAARHRPQCARADSGAVGGAGRLHQRR
jgi:GTP-binding protein HflX